MNLESPENASFRRFHTVRGNQRVVSDNPEATYDTLNKYGEDLVENARNQKLDPVIGRECGDPKYCQDSFP